MTEEQKKRRRRKKQWARRENWATEERKQKRQREHWAIEERKKRRRREKQCRMHTKNFNALFGSTPYYAQCHSCFKFRWFGLKHITLFTMSRVIQISWIMHNVTFASKMFFFGWEHIKLFTMSCLQTTTQVTSIHEINNIVMQKLFKAYAYTLFYSYHIQIQF